jgi:hypothetical protein
MFLMSVLLSAITLNPAMAPPQFARAGIARAGIVQGDVISPDKVCKPGDICAKGTMPKPYENGCFFNNFWNANNGNGGTPLTVDVTESGKNGKPVYIYWVNATNLNISLKNGAKANFYCPPLS